MGIRDEVDALADLAKSHALQSASASGTQPNKNKDGATLSSTSASGIGDRSKSGTALRDATKDGKQPNASKDGGLSKGELPEMNPWAPYGQANLQLMASRDSGEISKLQEGIARARLKGDPAGDFTQFGIDTGWKLLDRN